MPPTLNFSSSAGLGDTVHLPQGMPGYEVVGELGRGGMGVVYKARQPGLDRVVALKMILNQTSLSVDHLARFRTEAQVLARLQHPHIVQVFETGFWNGVPYIALEYVSGGSLDRFLNKTPQVPTAATRFAQILARAMQAAHNQGIIHRDLKPANILLLQDQAGNDSITNAGLQRKDAGPAQALAKAIPKITDFGLAKQLDADQGQTTTGDILGTPAYMAPEQAAGRISDIGPATDIYALGVILYEMLTGTVPFRGPTSLDTLEAVRTQEPVPPSTLQPKVPRDLELICLKCLYKERSRRFSSAGELADELERFLTGQPLRVTRPVGRLERTWRWCRRHPARATAVGLLVIFLATLISGLGWIAWRESEHAIDLANEQLETKGALRRATESEKEAVKFRKDAERLTVDLLFDQGLEMCQKGDVAGGLLSLAQALEAAERSEASEVTQRALRQNIALWSQEIRQLRWIGRHRAGYVADTLSNDPNRSKRSTNPRPSNLGLRSLLFHPTEPTLLTCDGNTATLRDLHTGQARGPSLQHENTILAAAFRPDGLAVATCGHDNTVRLWEVPSGKPYREPIRLPEPPHTVAFSPDGARLLWAHPRGAEIFDLSAKAPVAPLRFEAESLMHTAVLSPNGRWLLTGHSAEIAYLWDTISGKKIATIKFRELKEPPRYMDGVHLAVFSRDSTRVAISSFSPGYVNNNEQLVKVCQVPSGQQITEFVVTPLWGLDLSPDGQSLLTASLAFQPRLWKVAEGKPSFRALGPADATADYWWGGYSRDGKLVVTADGVGKAQCWKADTAEAEGPPLSHSTGLFYAGFSPGDRHLITWTSDGGLRVSEGRRQGQNTRSLPSRPGDKILTIDPMGEGMLVFTAEQDLQLRRASDGELLLQLGKQDGAGTACFSPDGTTIWSADGKGMLRTFSAATGTMQGDPIPVRWAPTGLKPSPDGRFLYGEHLLWDVTNRKEHLFEIHRFVSFGFPSDGPRMVVSTNTNYAELFDPLANQRRGKTYQTNMQVHCVAMTADANLVFAGSTDGQIRIWKQATSETFGTPLVQKEAVVGLLPSLDGKRLLSTSLRFAVLWDVVAGKELGTQLPRPTQWTFSPDSQLMAMVDEKNQAHLRDAVHGKPLGPVVALPGKASRLEFNKDHRRLTIFGTQGEAWQMDLGAANLPKEARQVNHWIQAITGLELDDNRRVRGLDEIKWSKIRQDLGK